MRLFEWFGNLYNAFKKTKSITDIIRTQVFEISSTLNFVIPHLKKILDRHSKLKDISEQLRVAKSKKGGSPPARIALEKVEPINNAILPQLEILNARCQELFGLTTTKKDDDLSGTNVDVESIAMIAELDRIIDFVKDLQLIIQNSPNEGELEELGKLNDRLREVVLVSKSLAENVWKMDELKKNAQKRFKGLQIDQTLITTKMPLIKEIFEKSRSISGESPGYHLDKDEEDEFITQARMMNDFHDADYRIEFREWWSARPDAEIDVAHRGVPHINIDKLTYNGATKLKLHVFFDSRAKNKRIA